MRKIKAFGKGVDYTHDRLERNILEQAIRLDNFFGDVKSEDRQNTKYQLRWRNSVRVEQDGKLKYGTSVRANVNLPRISERLRIIISGENEPEPFAPSLPEDPGNPGFDRTSRDVRLVNTELRYGLLQTPSTILFLGAGVRLKLPLEAFARSRFQYINHLSDVSLIRFGETLFVKNTDVLGETTEISLEHLLDPKTLLRLANSDTVSYEIKGVEWGTELSLIRELSPQSAINLTAGVYGNTSVRDWIENYRLLARYRRNFLRSWLFYELEPEISWPRMVAGNFPPKFAFTMRLEIVFQDSARGKEKKAGTP